MAAGGGRDDGAGGALWGGREGTERNPQEAARGGSRNDRRSRAWLLNEILGDGQQLGEV